MTVTLTMNTTTKCRPFPNFASRIPAASGFLHVAAAAVIGLSALTGCSTNPATGQRNLNMIGSGEEARITQQAAPELLKGYGGEVDDPTLNAYVRDLGMRMAAISERPEMDWQFYVVDSAVINAFALPGGAIFISRALLERFDSEAQLAGVLGHEIGHVTARHIGQQLTQARLITVGGIAAAVAGEATDQDWLRYVGVGATVGGGVYMLKFGRDQESQADELGVRYMTRMGYNPVGLLQVMEIFESMSGGARQPEWLSTHPHPETRKQRLTQLIREEHPNFEDTSAYQFGFDTYKTNVLDRLAKLPAPRHNPAPNATNNHTAAPLLAGDLAEHGCGNCLWHSAHGTNAHVGMSH